MTATSEPHQVLHGRYHLLCQLGQGGMGSVWLAEDRRLKRAVALKELVPHSGGLDLQESRARALVEARAMARVRHPAIVRIHDLFFTGDDPWIVMEYINGRSLADKIADGLLDERKVAAIGLMVLQGLRAVHAAGVVHRDVKPANILVAEDDSIFLVDFGIAKIAGDMALTGQSKMLGTIEFMAPERILGVPARPAADLWSLGVTMFFALEGRSPFLRQGERGHEATMAAILHGDPPRPVVKGRLADVVLQLLRKESPQRPDAAEVERVLTSILAGPASAARASSPTSARSHAATQPSRLPDEPPRDPLSARELAAAVEIVSNSGTDSAAAVLLAMPDEHAAQVLARSAPRVAGELLQAMAVTRPRKAGAILQILAVGLAGRAVNYLSPGTAASILATMSVKAAVRILSQADPRTVAGVLTELPCEVSAQLVRAMPRTRAVAVLGFVKPVTVAAVMQAAPDDHNGKLLSQLSPSFRTLVLSHM
jgi:eukaryotic-like serine/threonine-protein kinase